MNKIYTLRELTATSSCANCQKEVRLLPPDEKCKRWAALYFNGDDDYCSSACATHHMGKKTGEDAEC